MDSLCCFFFRVRVVCTQRNGNVCETKDPPIAKVAPIIEVKLGATNPGIGLGYWVNRRERRRSAMWNSLKIS